MAHLIKKPSALGSDTVYYVGGTRWSDNRSEAQSFVDEACCNLSWRTLTALMVVGLEQQRRQSDEVVQTIHD